jgi:hypothetical protein
MRDGENAWPALLHAVHKHQLGTAAALIGGGWPMQPFVEALAAKGIPASSPYYNTGAVICRSVEFLLAWRAAAVATPFHTCFDQNLFNLLAHERGRFMRLPAAWNVHGAMLGQAEAADAIVLHATSMRGEHHATASGSLGFQGDQIHDSKLRVFRDSSLRAKQERLFADFFAENRAELRAAGVFG